MSGLQSNGVIAFTTGAGAETKSRARITAASHRKAALRLTVISHSTSGPVLTVELRSAVTTGTPSANVLAKVNPIDPETIQTTATAFTSGNPTSGGTVLRTFVVQPGQTRSFPLHMIPGNIGSGNNHLLDIFTQSSSAGDHTLIIDIDE